MTALVDARDVEIIAIGKVLKSLYGDCWWERVTYRESGEGLRLWCSENGAHYYSRPREDFFLHAAREEAAALGLSKVVVEDLS